MASRAIIDKKSYFLAFFITLFIFSIGIYVGDSLNNDKINEVVELNEDLRTASLTIQTQYDLVSQNPCEFINDSNIFSELLDVSMKAEFMENQLGSDDPDVRKIKNYYSTLMIQHWLFNENIQQSCPSNDLHDVIYIYSNEDDCSSCDAQGFILTNIRKDNPDLRVFSFDHHIDNSALFTLEKMFFESIETFPILIIDDKVHQGFLSREAIENLIYISDNETNLNNTNSSINLNNLTIIY